RTIFSSALLAAVLPMAAFCATAVPAAQPTISPASSKYYAAQTISMSDSTSGAAIYYTTDGSIPTAASRLYKGPFAISSSQSINAVAIAKGSSLSPVAKAWYTIQLAVA